MSRVNSALTAADAARARRSWSAGGSPRCRDSRRAASAAFRAWPWLARWRRANSSAIWLAAVLMNVPGPYTTFAGSRSAISRQTAGSLRSPCSGTLPERQPSSRSTRPRSEVSTVRVRSPLTSTSTASSPKSRFRRSVALKLSDPRSTRVSVAALGSSRSASAAPPSARNPVTVRTSSGRRVSAPTTRPNASPFIEVSLVLPWWRGCSRDLRQRLQLRIAPGLADLSAQRRLLDAGRPRVRVLRPAVDEAHDERLQIGRQVRQGRLGRGRHRVRRADIAAVHVEMSLALQLVVAAGLRVWVRAVRPDAVRVAGQHLGVRWVRRAQVVQRAGAREVGPGRLGGRRVVGEEGGDLPLVEAEPVDDRREVAQEWVKPAQERARVVEHLLGGREPASAEPDERTQVVEEAAQ